MAFQIKPASKFIQITPETVRPDARISALLREHADLTEEEIMTYIEKMRAQAPASAPTSGSNGGMSIKVVSTAGSDFY